MTTPGTGYILIERKVGDLWVDPAVQRSLKKHRVEKMAKDFRADALGVITTSYRGPKRIHVIDGQHRYRAAEAAGHEGPIQTMEYHGLSLPEEAALFRLLNATEKVSRIDQFLVRCIEEDPAALRLKKALDVNGWSLASGAMDSRLSAIASLERVYAKSPEAAEETLAVLTSAYGHRAAAVQGPLLEGIGVMLAHYAEHNVDLTDLAKRLGGIPGGPDGLVGIARGYAVARNGNLSNYVARVAVDVYNQRRRTTALPPWTK